MSSRPAASPWAAYIVAECIERQGTQHGDGNGVGRAIDELPRGIEQGPDGRHDDGRIKTILRRQSRDAGISHRLRHRDGRHRQTGHQIQPRRPQAISTQGNPAARHETKKHGIDRSARSLLLLLAVYAPNRLDFQIRERIHATTLEMVGE